MMVIRLLFGVLITIWLQSGAASLLAPEDDSIEVWPSIPVIFAADIEEYKLVRDIFRGLHLEQKEPATIKTLLKQVDKMRGRTTGKLWRTYDSDLIGYYDRLTEENRIENPKLHFSFDGIKPAELPEDIKLDSPQLEALAQKEGVSGVFAYVTYTKMSQRQLRATLTLIRLRDGFSKSFTVTDQAHKIAERHAQLLFDYLYRTPFPHYRNPLQQRRWLLPAPQDRNRPVTLLQARLACRSQGAQLPTVDELILGEQAGPYNNGVILIEGAFYHAADDRRLLGGETSDPRGKIRMLRSDRQKARYYCIRTAPMPVVAPAVGTKPASQSDTPAVEGMAAPSQVGQGA